MAQYPSCALALGALDAIVRVSKRRHVSTHRSMAMATIDSIPESEIYRHIVEQSKDYAVFVLDPAGRVVTWNEGARRLKGYDREEAVGQHFSMFYAPEDRQRGWPAHELTVATAEGRFEDEGWRLRKDGSRFWANVVITTLRDERGGHLGFSKFTRDLTRRRMHEEALRQSEERFRLLVEGVTDYAIYMLDVDGLVTSWNAGAQRITGYTRDEILGTHFSRFYAEDERGTLPWEELANARRTGRAETEGWRVRRNGERFWARVVVTALYDAERRLHGFAKVTQDLTDRRHIQSLEQAAKKVAEFIAVLAHELRNPLAPIRSAVDVMARLPVDHPSQAAMRSVVERQTSQLVRIVDDILDMARITRGEFTIEHAPVDLSAVAHAAIETVRPLIDEKSHTLTGDFPAVPIVVEGDADRLTQLLANLLGNAARYTPPGGRIGIAVREAGHYASLSVRDSGPGIAADARERVFDMFVRGDDARAAFGGGLGVGLALARKIAELHGGSLDLAGEPDGAGAEFRVRLPLKRTISPTAASPALPPAASRSVLIVDDNHDAAITLEALLNGMGHRALVATTGAAAIEKLATSQPDYVFLDLGMPDMDGYEVARRIRAARLARQPRIVAVTGWGQEDDRERTQAAGFDAHLVKPASVYDIAKVLSEGPHPAIAP
jgi:PAS domain S-box-containing protein